MNTYLTESLLAEKYSTIFILFKWLMKKTPVIQEPKSQDYLAFNYK